MEFSNSLGYVVYNYNKYVEAQEKNGEDAVSFFKYGLLVICNLPKAPTLENNRRKPFI